MQPAQLRVAPADSLSASTNTCAVSPNPSDNTLVKPLRTQNAIIDEPVPESSLRGSIDSSIAVAPSSQTMPSSQISTPATDPAPAANTAQPDSSGTSVEAQEAAAVPSSVRTEFVQPSAVAIVPDDTERVRQGDTSTISTIGTMTFLALTTPPEMFPILVLALLMAGLLFRVVIRIAAAHSGRRIRINGEFGKNDSRLDCDGAIKVRNEPIDDDLARSAGDQWSDNSRRMDHASDIKDEIRKRQDMLEKLTRNLDRMLRSPRVA